VHPAHVLGVGVQQAMGPWDVIIHHQTLMTRSIVMVLEQLQRSTDARHNDRVSGIFKFLVFVYVS
jgi:hypothetical protein